MATHVVLGTCTAEEPLDLVVVSPPAGELAAQIESVLEEAAKHEGVVWVDGEPVELVDAVAARLGVPIGDPGALAEPQLAPEGGHEHRWTYNMQRTFEVLGAVLTRGKVYTCLECGCGAMQIQGR